jgi:hypothetical protein
VVIPLFSLLAWASLATGTAAGVMAGTVFAGLYARKVSKTVGNTGVTAPDAATLAARGLGHGAVQLSTAACRHYWPAAVAGAVLSKRCRRAVAAAAVVDAVHGWATRRRLPDEGGKPIGPVGYMALQRLDDLAYGAGLWSGVIRQRTVVPLRPDIKR